MTSPNDNLYKFKHLVRTHVRSYRWASRGLVSIFLQQLNFKIELFASLVVVSAGLYFDITETEWLVVTFVIFIVLVTETMNSAIEAIADTVEKSKHQDIRYAKDVGAGAVLLAAIGAAIIGLLIFLPYIHDKFF